jgi:cobM_cbiF: precorrin-4 C11-methyltransferase
LQLQRH